MTTTTSLLDMEIRLFEMDDTDDTPLIVVCKPSVSPPTPVLAPVVTHSLLDIEFLPLE